MEFQISFIDDVKILILNPISKIAFINNIHHIKNFNSIFNKNLIFMWFFFNIDMISINFILMPF